MIFTPASLSLNLFSIYPLLNHALPVHTSFWIPRSRGSVAITLKWDIVILNEVKNLIESMSYETEILRLKPQNDIATQSPSRGMTGI